MTTPPSGALSRAQSNEPAWLNATVFLIALVTLGLLIVYYAQILSSLHSQGISRLYIVVFSVLTSWWLFGAAATCFAGLYSLAHSAGKPLAGRFGRAILLAIGGWIVSQMMLAGWAFVAVLIGAHFISG